MEGVRRLRLVQTANGDDDAGHRRPEARQRDVRDARFHQGAREQPGARAEQPARVGKVHGEAGLSAGRQGREVRVQTTSVLVRTTFTEACFSK